jgi:hypothetical protein
MRLLALFLLALPALLPAEVLAQAKLNKCIDAQGKVTYSNLPCRNAREVRAVEIDPAPLPDPVRKQPLQEPVRKPPAQVEAVQPAKPAEPKPAVAPTAPAPIRAEARSAPQTIAPTGKPAASTSARQCDTLTDRLGRVFDKMDQARRKGYTQEEMDAWNQEVNALERQKQQSGCF